MAFVYPILIIVFISILVGGYRERRIKKRSTLLFEGRKPKSDKEVLEEYFPNTEVPVEVIRKVREIFCEFLGEEMRALEPDDDLSGDYAMNWDLDSMADVEIVIALEDEFGVAFSNEEALQMKSIRDIAEAVTGKLTVRDEVVSGRRDDVSPAGATTSRRHKRKAKN